MTVKAVLWKQRIKKDGTAHVRISVYRDRKRQYYPTGIYVSPTNWSTQDQKVIGLPKHLKDQYNLKIAEIKARYLSHLATGAAADEMEKKSDDGSLLQFLDLYIDEIEKGLHPISKGTARNYKSLRTRLRQYRNQRVLKDILYSDISMNWYMDYYNFIKEIGGGITGFSNHIKIVKKVLKVAHLRDLHQNMIYKHPEFIQIKKAPGSKVYLSEQEIAFIEEVDLDSFPHLAVERDRFLISYYFIMRYSDSRQIAMQHILVTEHGPTYAYTAQKTGIYCMVPISSKANQLLQDREYQFSGGSNQKSNGKIKEIGMLAGITQIVNQDGLKAPKQHFDKRTHLTTTAKRYR